METAVLKAVLSQLTPSQLLLTVVLALVFIIVTRVNSYITQVKRLDKQQHKVERIISALPCVSKENATWLQDFNRNGGSLPEKIKEPDKK